MVSDQYLKTIAIIEEQNLTLSKTDPATLPPLRTINVHKNYKFETMCSLLSELPVLPRLLLTCKHNSLA